MKHLILGFMFLSLASIATAAEQMTGKEITALLSGNSMTGVTSKDVAWTEFYTPGGDIRGISKGKRHSGTWLIDGDRVCFDYPAWEYASARRSRRQPGRSTCSTTTRERPTSTPFSRVTPATCKDYDRRTPWLGRGCPGLLHDTSTPEGLRSARHCSRPHSVFDGRTPEEVYTGRAAPSPGHAPEMAPEALAA